MHPALDRFIDASRAAVAQHEETADRVIAIAPMMQQLVAEAPQFLTDDHFRSDPDHYARNAIYICPTGNLSLFALVWLPGQWTPVHDHGSWGVVGVLQGLLEERSLMAVDGHITADHGIRL